MRTITTCAGIGDAIWIFQKLVNSGEQFNWILPDSTPQRGHQIFELMPQLSASCTYHPGLSYRTINSKNAGAGKQWCQIKDNDFYLSANSHLETGHRIEGFLSDLPTSYALNYNTSLDSRAVANARLYGGKVTGKHYIGLYTSAYSNTRNWNMWAANEWHEFATLLYRPGVVFVIIGAKYDVGVMEELTYMMERDGIPFINTTGEPLPVVIEIMKRLSYFIGFPSGLSILNETLCKDGMMFYAAGIKNIINTWADPARIEAGNIKECLQDTPERIFKWIADEYKIFDKLEIER